MFNALPAYQGGKRRLAPLIFALLGGRVPPSSWRRLVFADPFLGGGGVSLAAKANGFRVVCNDVALRSAVVGRALIANGSRRLGQADVLALLRDPCVAYQQMAQERFVPDVLSRAHARVLDRALYWARSDDFPEPLRSLALVLIIKWLLRVQPMSMLRGTDAKAAFSGDLDRVSPRRVGHYVRSFSLLRPSAWWRLAEDVNRGVFPGQGAAHQQDVFAFLSHVAADVVYLDPPYAGTASYEREYGVLDELLEGEQRDVSGFSRSADLLQELFLACRHIPVWLVSFNNSVLSLEELEAMVRLHRPNVTSVRVAYRHLGSIASEEKNAKNEEYVILATA